MNPSRLAPLVLLAAALGLVPSPLRAQDPAPAEPKPAPAPAEPKPAPEAVDARADLDKLRGSWQCVLWVFDGQRRVESEQGFESSYDGNRLTLTNEGHEYRHALVTLDPARTPKAMNTWDQDGPFADRTNRGIYRIEGNTLTICVALDPEAGRPTEFTSEAGSRRLLVIYRRREP